MNLAPYHVGYCTNVHAGTDLATTRTNLERFALPVKRAVSPAEPLGVGLWLSARAVEEMLAEKQVPAWRDWLDDAGLVPFTMNGFPYFDFHEKVVKYRVYLPTWWEPARLEHTLRLFDLQHVFLPAGLEGSISTLPISWGTPRPSDSQLSLAAHQLRQVADHLARRESETGRLQYLCLEPEPGCVLQRANDIVDFFEKHLLPGANEKLVRRHLRVCHDVCHSAVMFEPQAWTLKLFASAGIRVGKIQVSSAVRVPFDEMSPEQRGPALDYLRQAFVEERYLHQTCVREAAGPAIFFEDLPAAIGAVDDPAELESEWRTHFHVPVYLDRFGPLVSSQSDILECLDVVKKGYDVKHLEVETYAWGVLPANLKQPDLAAGIADELNWLIQASRAA